LQNLWLESSYNNAWGTASGTDSDSGFTGDLAIVASYGFHRQKRCIWITADKGARSTTACICMGRYRQVSQRKHGYKNVKYQFHEDNLA